MAGSLHGRTAAANLPRGSGKAAQWTTQTIEVRVTRQPRNQEAVVDFLMGMNEKMSVVIMTITTETLLKNLQLLRLSINSRILWYPKFLYRIHIRPTISPCPESRQYSPRTSILIP